MIVTLGDHASMIDDLNGLEAAYERSAVDVIRLYSPTEDSVFHRDVVAWTPYGLIKCRMANAPRRREPDFYFEQIAEYGYEPALTLSNWATFEGADLLWINRSRALLGIGNRTNKQGAYEVADFLKQHGAEVDVVTLPAWHDQHLLGVANAWDGQLWADSAFAIMLRQVGVRDALMLPGSDWAYKGPNWVSTPTQMVGSGLAMNTQRVLENYYPKLQYHPASIDQLLRHGGGPGCATGILAQ